MDGENFPRYRPPRPKIVRTVPVPSGLRKEVKKVDSIFVAASPSIFDLWVGVELPASSLYSYV
jgi:hypothetical protein